MSEGIMPETARSQASKEEGVGVSKKEQPISRKHRSVAKVATRRENDPFDDSEEAGK